MWGNSSLTVGVTFLRNTVSVEIKALWKFGGLRDSYHRQRLLKSLNTRIHKTCSKIHFGDLGVDGREIMRLILYKEGGAINGLQAGQQRIGCSRRKDFPLLCMVQTDYAAYPALHPVGTLGCEIDHLAASGAEFRNI
jgi:hypothetical protein